MGTVIPTRAHEVPSRGESIVLAIEAIARTGMIFEQISMNELVLRMPLAGNDNHNGILYAGSLFSLAECAAGVLFLNRYDEEAISPVCSNVSIRFRRPALTDVRLKLAISDTQFDELESQALDEGKGVVTFEERLEDTNGEVVSIAEVTYVLLKI